MTTHDGRAMRLALLGGVPAVVLAAVAVAYTDWSGPAKWTLGVVAVAWWLALAVRLRNHVARPMQTLSNLLAGLREGDYSTRARLDGALDGADPLQGAMREANALADVLFEQRLGAMDATTLLRKVMEQAKVAVIAFDEERALRLANGAAQRLLGQPFERLRGRTAEDLGLEACLDGETPRLLDPGFAGGGGRWELRRAEFRQRGKPHQLLVLTDLSRALHEEERTAWKRLIRVISHEINNSLAPISSVAQSLRTRHAADDPGDDWETDLARGLELIADRGEALSRFIGAHAELARLPNPTVAPVEVDPLVRRVAALESRLAVELQPGPELTINADSDQIEQMLINLVRNAADAALETGGGAEITWTAAGEMAEITIRDEGPGLPPRANLFVPLFTTKPGGSGVGLALARQIALTHGGTLTLEDREDKKGCLARIHLPLTSG